MKTAVAAAREMSQEAFSDYHLYTLEPKDDGQQQPDEAGQHARRDRAFPVVKRYVVDGQRVLLQKRAAPRRAYQGRRAGVLPVQERRQIGPRHPAAVWRRPRLPVRLEGRNAVRRRGSHPAHAHRRDAEPEDRHAFDVVAERKQVDFEKITSTSTRSNTRSSCAITRRSPSASRSTSRLGARGACCAAATSGPRATPGPRSSRCRSPRTERPRCTYRVRVTY